VALKDSVVAKEEKAENANEHAIKERGNFILSPYN